MMTVEEKACNFADWCVVNGYLSLEDEDNLLDEIINNFKEAYMVAPKLINLLASIANK